MAGFSEYIVKPHDIQMENFTVMEFSGGAQNKDDIENSLLEFQKLTNIICMSEWNLMKARD